MGIGVSYTGANGKRKEFTAGSVDALRSAMDSVSPRRSMHGVDAAQIQPLMPEQKKDVQPKGGSAIVKDFRGELCLRGEEGDALVEGRRYYGSLNGRKGYFTISEMDPPMQGKMCGQWMNIETKPDNASIDINSNYGAWSIPISRTSCELTGDGKLRVFNFFRELKFSADGRCVGVTEESPSLVGEFECGGGGDYCVVPEFDSDGVLSALHFGTSEKLKKNKHNALEEVKTVDTYIGCPYGSGGST